MISDSVARATALDPTRSFIIQAPAGSGKTGLLVYRMLTLLARVDQPQQVLSITFTRKATAEMRERLLELLKLADANQRSNDVFEQQGIDLATEVLARDRQQNWQLLNSPHQLQIFTIDSFCAKLTSSMPWLSRLGDRPRTTDNAQAHYAAAVEQLLSELLDADSPIIEPLKTVLFELDYNYQKARQLFSSMLAKRDQWLRHLVRHDLDSLRGELEKNWQRIVEPKISALSTMLGQSDLEYLLELATRAAAIANEKKPGDVTPLSVFIEEDVTLIRPNELSVAHWRGLAHLLVAPSTNMFRKQVNISLGFIAKSDDKAQFEDYLKQLADDNALLEVLLDVIALPDINYGEQDWQQLLALEKVLKALVARLQLRFRSVGECDHSEITQRANLALQELENPTDLGLRMDYHLQHILVDEFQDTSNGQIELLKKLTSGWANETQTPKTLLLVGDPMQSIYRFREADVSLFLQVADNANTQVFDNIVIDFLQLTENFRSSAGLVSWFNTTFEPSFPGVNNVLTGGIRYAKASSSKAKNDTHCVDYLLAHDREQEAQLLLSSVQEAIQELPNEQAKVAILVRSRSQLVYLLPSLQRAGIEYAGVDIQPLHAQQAVIDVVALCKAICREDDRVSWLALLRGPWCGLSLSEIKPLVRHTEQTIWQQLLAFDRAHQELGSSANSADEFGAFSEVSIQRLSRFIDAMRGVMAQRQQVELGSLTRWAWRALGGEQTLFSANPDDIETVFELIASLQRGGDLYSMSDLDNALQDLYAKPLSGTDQDTKLVISTMHKSKGLQFDTVILPGISNHPRADDKGILMWAELQTDGGGSGLLLAPLRLTPDDTDHYSYLRRLDSQRALHEAIRLMYVATTRAERKLVLLGNANCDDETGEVKPPRHNSLLGRVWDALGQEFSFPLEATQNTELTQELLQTLYRLPEDYTPHLPPAIDWQVSQQLSSQTTDSVTDADSDQDSSDIEYEWATAVATGVGIVLHDWLQHNSSRILEVQVDSKLRQRWHAELIALRVPGARIEYAVKRLTRAINNIQADVDAHFLFADYPEQQNEYTVSAFENGQVNQYRIDRTFVDHDGVRWIIDYKSTDTNNQDLKAFVNEQVAQRHRSQLQKYGELLSQIENRPIKLAVYFPLLKQLRTWSY